MRIFGGVGAKCNRAIDQLEALQGEVNELRSTPNPYGYLNTVDPAGGHYVFRLHPAWGSDTTARWAVIIGEIAHDLRSALDHLVWQAVTLSGEEPDRDHAFPLLDREPEGGFADWATRPPGRRTRHGKLLGATPDAISLVEMYQPYRGDQAGFILARVDALWQQDKHRMTLPIVLVAGPPQLELEGCDLLRREERMEDGILTVEIDVTPLTPQPKVELRSDAPFDIGYDDRPVIDDLLVAAQIVVEMKYAFEELFPDAEDLRHRRSRAAFDRLISSHRT
jgi:hypothetical protein